jgi:acyl-CoA reductase LuxC
VLHGPKVSVGYLARESLTRTTLRGAAARAALDVALYDQQGCLSPHAFYVERGGPLGPAAFASALGGELEGLRERVPRSAPDRHAAAGIQLYRAQARFDEATDSRGTRVLGSSEGTDWTVVYEDGPRFSPSPAYRTVRVHAVDGIEEAVRALSPAAGQIEAIGLEARGRRRASLAAALASIGVPRVAALGSLQRPSPLGTHGGVHRLRPFIRWSTVEIAAPKGRGR